MLVDPDTRTSVPPSPNVPLRVLSETITMPSPSMLHVPLNGVPYSEPRRVPSSARASVNISSVSVTD